MMEAEQRPPTDDPILSIVVPVFNEEENVGPLYEEIRFTLESIGDTFEIIFVNDGSTDGTLSRLREIQQHDANLRVLNLRRNSGESAALSAGFHHSLGEFVVTLDGDGQNDPADIPRLLEVLKRHSLQAVSGRRVERQEDYWLRVLPSRIANELIVRVTRIPVYDGGCGLKAYRRSAVRRIHLPPGMNRFLPAILGVKPSQVAEVPISDRARQHGRSHYGISRTFVVLRDLCALPFLIRDPKRAEIHFGLATAGAAALGALLLDWSWRATIICDLTAVWLASIWWNVRRFNHAQSDDVYDLEEENPRAES
jgi:glycosyltransferase involved in cell wall biosynthesis